MVKTAFGEMTFSIGWKTQRNLSIYEKKYPITIKLQAYYKTDVLPAKQLKSCDLFVNYEDKMIEEIERLMSDYADDFGTRFIPQTLLIKKNGSIALLCDDENNPDEGIAICLYPETSVVSQDDYL